MRSRAAIGVLAALVVVALLPVVIYFAFPEALLTLASTMERRAAGVARKSITVDNHNIVYLEGGEGDTILLLHGFSADKDNWTRFSKLLTPEYHVVAIDLPGFGESSKIDGESYTVANQVKRLDSIVASLGLNRFHLAGNSMGGAIAGKYTVTYPGKVLSLGLLDTAGAQPCPVESEFARMVKNGENVLLVKTAEDFDRVLQFVFIKPPWIPRPVKQHLARQSVSSREFNEKIFQELVEENYRLTSDLPRIRVKTLVLWGDTDRLIDVSCARVFEAGLPRSTTVIMKDCGHMPMVERPTETANHYLAFLRT